VANRSGSLLILLVSPRPSGPTISFIYIPRIDISPEKRQFRLIPRGASNDAEMAVSRTLEPDPGHAGVGTENGVTSARRHFLFSASPGSP